MNAAPIVADVVSRLKQAVGGSWIADPADKAPYLNDIRGLYHGDAPLVLRPATTAEVAEVVKSGAEFVISAEPSCLLNIGGYLEKKGEKIRSLHIAEVLARRAGDPWT